MQVIFDHVANGGSALDICNAWNIKYSDFIKHVRANEKLLQKYNDALEARKEWAHERILKEVQNMGTWSMKDLFNSDGSRKDIQQLPESFLSSIKEVSADGDIKMMDKLKALELLSKQLGLLVDKKEVSGTLSLEQIILSAIEKGKKEK